MLIQADDVDVGELEADIVIIGAGAAGITIARSFIGKAHSVIVLESGGLSFDAEQQELYRGEQTGIQSQALHQTRLRFFGGSTNHWAGWCRPLEEDDFTPKPGWTTTAWPLSRTDLDGYYSRAAEVLELGPPAFDDLPFWQRQAQGTDLKALALEGTKLQTSIFQVSPPTRFGSRYREELTAAKNIRVVLDANVIDLQPKEAPSSPQRVGQLIAITPQARQLRISGKQFVLAVGGIETPRILLSSTRFHPNGAGNENDLVGRYFQNHPWLSRSAVLQFPQSGAHLPLYFQQTPIGGSTIFASLTPTTKAKADAEIGGFRLLLRPYHNSTRGMDSLRYSYRKLAQAKIPEDLDEHISNMISDWDVIANSAYKTLLKRKENLFDVDTSQVQGASIDLNFEQRPHPDSRVVLGNGQDRYGIRRVQLNWRLDEQDRRTARTALQWAAEAFGQMGLGRVRIKHPFDPSLHWPDQLTGSRHHMGTTRMASSPLNGVVDENCRVHSINNLFIAGSAVFPTSGYANPTLTIVALALRLADHIEARLT